MVSLGLKKQALKGKLWLQSLDSSYHYVIKTCLLVEKSRFGDTNKQVSFCWREMTVVQHWGIQPLGLYKLSPINTHHTFPNIFLDLGATLKNSKISQEFSQIICKQITLLRVIPTMTCWVEVVRWGLSLRIWWEEWRIWEHWFQVSLA